MIDYRTETDAFGTIAIAGDRLWGPQTQRSIEHFDIGRRRFVFTRPVIRALGLVKRSAALANCSFGTLMDIHADAIVRAADEVISGALDDHFPLVVFQTGSGTQTNMNANEVIARRANEILGFRGESSRPIHPNDHVNRSQSSNDVFPTVMHLAVASEAMATLKPVVLQLRTTLHALSDRFATVVKVGRTHLQDATPVTVGQEIGDWVAQIDFGLAAVMSATELLYDLAIGATAVGTGLNAPAGFGAAVVSELQAATGVPFRQAPNLFAALSSHHPMVAMSAALRTLASALMKMANDVRWLSSGPRAGIGELRLPENEQGSSIMPGKINPTQAEALLMVVAQVFGNDTTVAFAGTQGNFQLNVAKPVILHNVLESIELLADACRSFDRFCAIGIEPERSVIAAHLSNSLMTVTALTPRIGYEAAADIASHAVERGIDLRNAAIEMGIAAVDFDAWVVPMHMTTPD